MANRPQRAAKGGPVEEHGAVRFVDRPWFNKLCILLEAPFGALSSVLVYGERVTGRMVAGLALIFVAMVVLEAGDALRERLRAF
jgi:hypothetical protein